MKLIAIDLDGTLLNSKGKVSKQNVDAIQQAIMKGIQVVIVTGRPHESARLPLKEASLDLPLICLNGAYYFIDGKINQDLPLTFQQATEILRVVNAENMYTEIFTNKGILSIGKEQTIHDIFMHIANDEKSKERMFTRSIQRLKEEAIQFVETFEIPKSGNEIIVYKIQCFSTDKNQLMKIKERINSAEVIVTSSGEINIEVNHISAQKGIALATYAKELRIPLSETMAIGDNMNDLSMLKIVGMPVAMGNAHKVVKDKVKFITETNDEHGVAIAINRIL